MPKRRNRPNQRRGRSRRSMAPETKSLGGVPISQQMQTPPIRFAQNIVASSDTGGLINLSLSADPGSSGQNFSEYSSFSGLYGEVRMIQFGIQIIPVPLSVDSKNTILALGSTLNAPIGSPTTANVLNLPNSRLVNIANMTASLGTVFTLRAPVGVIFTNSQANVHQEVAAGSLQATIYLVGSGFPISTDVFNVLVFGVYQFRSRL